jgi:hypothetical protein
MGEWVPGLSSTNTFDIEVRGVNHVPADLLLRKGPSIYCVGGWIDCRISGRGGEGKKSVPWPGIETRLSSTWPAIILTELPRITKAIVL